MNGWVLAIVLLELTVAGWVFWTAIGLFGQLRDTRQRVAKLNDQALSAVDDEALALFEEVEKLKTKRLRLEPPKEWVRDDALPSPNSLRAFANGLEAVYATYQIAARPVEPSGDQETSAG